MREHTDPSKLAMLRQFPGLRGAATEKLQRMSMSLDVVDVPVGQRLFEQGRFGRSVYLIVSGSAGVVRDGIPVATLAAGDIVGEMAVAHGQARNATVEALTPMRLLVAGPGAVGLLFNVLAMPVARAELV